MTKAHPNTSSESSIQGIDYQALFESTADAILVLKDGSFVACNDAAVALFGYTDRTALLERHPSILSPPAQPDGSLSADKADEFIALAMQKTNHRFEWIHLRASGEEFPVEVLLTALPAEDGSFTINAVLRDISERKQLEQELRHSQKMDVVGKLAGGIAHDFNNQLVPILGYSDLLATALKDDAKHRDWALEIHRASNYAATLVNKLLAFSRKETQQPIVLNVQETIEELLGMLGKLIGEDIELEFQGLSQPAWIRADVGDIEQIVLNLAANSRDAMPDGGTITLSLDLISQGVSPYVHLRVSDDGEGMDTQTLKQIFVPFFTTKELGSGTGLGLSTVQELTRNAGGEITAKSELGCGTSIDVSFPLVAEGLAKNSNKQPHTREATLAPSSKPHILVVEDEEQIALFIERILIDQGFLVTTAQDGGVALDLIKAQTPDLIVTDVIMSRMSGPTLIQAIRSLGFETPVIFMSGYTDDRLVAQGFDPNEIALVRKPFTAETLSQQIKAALAIA